MKTGSSLLINEPALQVLPSLAVKLGLNEAIVLQQIHFWITANRQRGVEPFEGRYWTYNTMKEWHKQFPWWSEKTIQRTIFKLESLGVLLSRTNKPGSYDHTKTYSIDYEKLDDTVCLNQSGQIDLNDEDNMTSSKKTESPNLLTESPSEITTEIKQRKGADAPPPQKRKQRAAPKEKALKDPNMEHPAVKAYREIVKLTPNEIQRRTLAERVSDFVAWRKTLVSWMLHGWSPRNIEGMINSYETGGNGNGRAYAPAAQQSFEDIPIFQGRHE